MESTDILNTFSKIISIIINPLLVAPLSFAIMIYLDASLEMKHIFFFISVLFTNFLPLITIYNFIQSGKVSSFDAPIKEQRRELLAIAAIYYAAGFIVLWYMVAPPIVTGLMFCYAVNTAIVWRITMAWKISIHMIGLGGPIVALWLAGHEYPLLVAPLSFAIIIYLDDSLGMKHIFFFISVLFTNILPLITICLLYTSDAADE